MNTAYRFRIYPNNSQQLMIAKTCGCCRFIYNRMLADKIAQYHETGKMLNNTPAQYKNEFPWLKEVDSLALSNVQLHLEKAYKSFFRTPSVGFPKYKSRHHSSWSYTTNLVNGNISLADGKLKLPKVGMIRIKQHREIPDIFKLKAVTVTKEPSGKYYASILFFYENQVEERPDSLSTDRVLGIDFAMSGMAVFSDGSRASYPMYYKKSQQKMGKEQRKLSHCQKGSRNYEKQRMKICRLHEKIRNQRKDFQHKLSHELAKEYDIICVEDLDMKNLSRCLHLGKGVMDNGYGKFLNQLEYKLERKNKKLVKIGRFYPSSKKCSCCGKVKEKLMLSERVYRCECGNIMDRDVNAAVNIREEGKRICLSTGTAA